MVSRYRTVFLDRDGVTNRMREDYVKSWEEFEILPGVVEAIGLLTRSGRDVIVLTNQAAIAKGLVRPEVVDEIHSRFAGLVATHGGRIRAFLICPHGKDDGCSCRKPAPGLFFRARDEMGVNLNDSIMVGDQAWDVQAAHAAGCDAILVGPNGRPAPLARAADYPVVTDLAAAVDLICAD